MSTVLSYLSTYVIIMYENSIKQSYVEYVEQYINMSWRKKELNTIIRRNGRNTRSRQDALSTRLRRVKDDLLMLHLPKASHPLYHAWIDEQRHLVLPVIDLKKDNVRYDIQCSPQDYLLCMLHMMRVIEACSTSVKNASSLRSSVVPKHVRLDTVTLIYLCVTEEPGKRSDYVTNGNLVKRQNSIWAILLKTDIKCFHAQGYTFDHHIERSALATASS